MIVKVSRYFGEWYDNALKWRLLFMINMALLSHIIDITKSNIKSKESKFFLQFSNDPVWSRIFIRKNCFLNVVSKSLRQYYLMINNIFNKCLNFHSKKLYKQISNGIYYLIFWWFDSDIGNHKWFSYLDNWINVDEIQTLDLMRFNSVWTFHLW